MSSNTSEYGVKFLTAVSSNKKERFSIHVPVHQLRIVNGECNEFYRVLFSVYDSVVFHTNQMAGYVKSHPLFKDHKGNLTIDVTPSSYRRVVALATIAMRDVESGGSIFDISVLFVLTPGADSGVYVSVTTIGAHEQMHDERVKIADIKLT